MAEAVRADYPRLARELDRAAERPGRTAEITLTETRVLHERFPEDPRVLTAWNAAEESAVREVEGAKRLRQRIYRDRQPPPVHRGSKLP